MTQSTQELVSPSQRGAVNGVQAALNMSFDLLRSVLLIIFPRMDTFGFLIMLSFVFVTIGLMSYCHFYVTTRKLGSSRPREGNTSGHQPDADSPDRIDVDPSTVPLNSETTV